jgi:branched-chain amino acid transport system substrate-binding protein
MRFTNIRRGLAAAAAVALTSFAAQAEEPVRIGLIEPFSGPIAAVGRDTLEGYEFFANEVNARGGVLGGRHIEIVPLDNAMNAEKTTQMLRKAVDDGLRYVSQGVGSNHALNIIKFLGKHNRRNPDQAILYLNYAAVTTSFTNELCSFWHFRFDANVDMKVAALVTQLGRTEGVSKVYLLNQNYAYGQAFQAAARRIFAERAPHIELVGDELIVPFGKVLDFTAYIAKIQASGADTVLTGNWGPDLIRFVKAAAEAHLPTPFYTIYGGLPSSIAAIGANDGVAVGMRQLTEMHENDPLFDQQDPAVLDALTRFTEQSGKSNYSDRIRWTLEMFAAALDAAGSDDPAAVGRALEGMTFAGPAGSVTMRAEDHQILMPLVISTMSNDVARPFVYDGKNFGVGWLTDDWVTAGATTLPTTCEMKRP